MNKLKSIGCFYSLLPSWIPWIRRIPLMGRLALRLQQMYETAPRPIRSQLHGYPVLLNPGNNYPFIIFDITHFNAPLVELVNQVFRSHRRPIVFLDVGAALGDTVMLLHRRCAEAVKHFICIEGDDEFFSLLEHNLQQFDNAVSIKVMLARENTQVRSLIKHHPGTAAAIGDKMCSAVRLDSLSEVKRTVIDLFKIDVDGFDGEVLLGASELLQKDRPAVIFEWHPLLIKRTGQDFYAGFEALIRCGYAHFLWFTNVGEFSHFTREPSADVVASWVDYLLRVNPRADEHFDIVALHAKDPLDRIALAEMAFARKAAHDRP